MRCWLFPCLALVVLAVTGCGGTFTPPIRGDIDFAGTRVAPGSPELQLNAVNPDGWSGQVGYRHALSPRDTVEAFAFDHKLPGDRFGFTMGGVGFRRHLSDVDAPIQTTLGFGAGIGVGGDNDAWTHSIHHYPGAIGSYVDLGVAWRAMPTLTLYAGGRAQRSVAFHWPNTRDSDQDPEAALPPTTDWIQAGTGARVDLLPLYLTLDVGYAAYSNRVREDSGFVLGVGLGMRFGSGH